MAPTTINSTPMDLDSPEDYHESSDEDFDINAPADSASSSSEDEGTADPNTRPKKRRKIAPSGAEDGKDRDREGEREEYVIDMAELDSGDEATIRRAQKKKEKKKKKKGKAGEGKENEEGEEWEGDSSGGEGGFVRTRGMRAREYVSLHSAVAVEEALARLGSELTRACL
jgi:hypothetical protein